MDLVLSLIAGADGRAALPGVAAALARRYAAMPDRLDAAACDLAVSGDATTVAAAARAAIGDAAIDAVVQPVAGRRKRLLVADLESTVIENEMLEELADFLGLRAHVAGITRRAMNGEIDFAAALEERVGLLRGLDAGVLEMAAARIRIMPGARELVRTMRAAGATTALVSGGFTVFAERVAAELGFDHVVANRLDLADGHIAGTVTPPLVTRETKRDTLLGLAAAHGIAAEETLAVGDGANDLPMLLAAGLGVAFRAKPAVAAVARWRLDHADLTGLLYAQGYRRTEFALS
jgi:phosphoserine phosphatase